MLSLIHTNGCIFIYIFAQVVLVIQCNVGLLKHTIYFFLKVMLKRVLGAYLFSEVNRSDVMKNGAMMPHDTRVRTGRWRVAEATGTTPAVRSARIDGGRMIMFCIYHLIFIWTTSLVKDSGMIEVNSRGTSCMLSSRRRRFESEWRGIYFLASFAFKIFWSWIFVYILRWSYQATVWYSISDFMAKQTNSMYTVCMCAPPRHTP